jgi:hypothetical protein
MLNNTGIKKTTYGGPVQILFNVQNQMSVGIKLAKNFAGAVTENGRKIVKAGTPLSGDLTARGTAFVAAADDSTGSAGDGKPAVGVLLHDVDVTDADANATLLIWGFVNLSRVDSTTAALITAARKTELAGQIWFLKD